MNECTETGWTVHHELGTAMSCSHGMFTSAASFSWFPNDNEHNAIVSILCTFQYQCTGNGVRFRMKINGTATSVVEATGSPTWSCEVFTDSSFSNRICADPNQNRYSVDFQFQPQGSRDRAVVKDVYVFVEVLDGLLPGCNQKVRFSRQE